MSRVAYLDCVGGLAGDMLLAALLDAGAELERSARVPSALGIDGRRDRRRARRAPGHRRAASRHRRPPTTTRTATTARSATLVEAAELPERARARSRSRPSRGSPRPRARIHGVPPEDVHFHELGSLDTLVDVCGAFVLLDDLGVERVACSPLPFARGLTLQRTACSRFLRRRRSGSSKGAPLVGVETEAELVTPTGAAIAATVVDGVGRRCRR